jgi:uncharacterized protein DUF669
MTINWTELAKVAGDGGFTVLPNGEYDAYVNSAQGGKTSTNKDRIRVTFKVESGPHAGSVVTNDFVITGDNANAMSIFFRNMAALNLPAEYFAINPSSSIDKVAADLQAKRSRCRLRLSSRTWQGQERNNVDAILPALPGTAPSAPPALSTHTPPAAHVPSVPVPSVPNLPEDLPF